MSSQSTIPARPLLREIEAAQLLNIEVATLRRWRWAGKGPVFRKIGAAVRYSQADIEDFIQAARRTSTSEKILWSGELDDEIPF